MADPVRALYVCTTIDHAAPSAPEKRGLYANTTVAIEDEDVAKRGLYANTTVAIEDEDVAKRALYACLSVIPLVDPSTPLELQLLDATNWDIEKILGAK